MTRILVGAILTVLGFAMLAGCSEPDSNTEIPGPIALTEEAAGHYCGMNILEHTGPKAQVHLKGVLFPIWFSQVRDAVAFTRLPEETQEAVAIYVNDMGKADDWNFPGDDTWIHADEAMFVIHSTKTGGMGAPEAIPFGSQQQAGTFVSEHGGQIVRFSDIPDAYVLAPVELKPQKRTITGALQ